MRATPTPLRRLLLPVPLLAALAVLAGCGDDGDSSSDAETETVFVDPTPTPSENESESESAPPSATATTTGDALCTAALDVGQILAPSKEVTYATGTGALYVVRSDGATGCVPISATADAGSFDPSGSPELELSMGTAEAGLRLTVTDYTDDGKDDLAANEGDPFVGVQFEGAYGVDSLHTSCTVVLTQLSPSAASGRIACDEPLDPWDGEWDVTAPDVTIDTVAGWFLLER